MMTRKWMSARMSWESPCSLAKLSILLSRRDWANKASFACMAGGLFQVKNDSQIWERFITPFLDQPVSAVFFMVVGICIQYCAVNHPNISLFSIQQLVSSDTLQVAAVFACHVCPKYGSKEDFSALNFLQVYANGTLIVICEHLVVKA